VVEDDDIVRAVITAVLEEDGYRVLSAINGAAAMQLLEHPAVPEPACIILDLWMPVMDGREFIDAYRCAGQQVPIIAVTGAWFPTSTMPAPDVDELLAKPFDIEELLGLVRKYAGGKRAGGRIRSVRALVPV